MQAETPPAVGKICRSGHELPAMPDSEKRKSPRFYWLFHHGMALADKLA
jgi:hypothetical protein